MKIQSNMSLLWKYLIIDPTLTLKNASIVSGFTTSSKNTREMRKRMLQCQRAYIVKLSNLRETLKISISKSFIQRQLIDKEQHQITTASAAVGKGEYNKITTHIVVPQ